MYWFPAFCWKISWLSWRVVKHVGSQCLWQDHVSWLLLFFLQPIKHCSELYSWLSLCVLYIETMSVKAARAPQSSLDTMGLWVCSMCVIICERTLRVYERKRGMGVTDSLMVTVAESWCLRAVQWQSYAICGMPLLKKTHSVGSCLVKTPTGSLLSNWARWSTRRSPLF